MKSLSAARMRLWLFIALLVAAPLSKYPSVSFPLYNFDSFRVGLYPLLALAFVLACLRPLLGRLTDMYQRQKLAMASIAILALVNLLGLFTALYKARSALLAASILLLLLLVLSAWWYVAYGLEKKYYRVALNGLLVAGVVYGVLSIVQFVLAGFGHQTLGLLCSGCNAAVFGFPRISGLAAEPQFHANAGLVFFFAGLGAFYRYRSRLSVWCTGLAGLGIGLTFSRGAWAATALGFLLFIILLRAQGLLRLKAAAKYFGVVVLSFIVALSLLIGASAYRNRGTPDAAYKTLRSIVQQVSLGAVNLPDSSKNGNFKPAGLVQASGSDRLSAAKLGVQAWHYNAYTTLFGVGAGNLGPFVVAHIDPNVPNNLTVYIHYVLVLAEFGLIGLLAFVSLFGVSLVNFIRVYWKHKNAAIYTAAACLMAAFLVQYFFFGSYINVPYIWLWGGIILGLQGKGVIMGTPHEK